MGADEMRRTEELLRGDEQVRDRLFDLRELLLGLHGVSYQLHNIEGPAAQRAVGEIWKRLTFLGARREEPCEERTEDASSVMLDSLLHRGVVLVRCRSQLRARCSKPW